MVQGINKEYIFKKDRYINKYLQLLNEKIYKEEIKIVAYCIMNNHAHLLIKVDDIKNLSMFVINERIKVFEIFENDEVIKKLIKFLKQQKKIRYTEMMKSLDITKGTMERLKK